MIAAVHTDEFEIHCAALVFHCKHTDRSWGHQLHQHSCLDLSKIWISRSVFIWGWSWTMQDGGPPGAGLDTSERDGRLFDRCAHVFRVKSALMLPIDCLTLILTYSSNQRGNTVRGQKLEWSPPFPACSGSYGCKWLLVRKRLNSWACRGSIPGWSKNW